MLYEFWIAGVGSAAFFLVKYMSRAIIKIRPLRLSERVFGVDIRRKLSVELIIDIAAKRLRKSDVAAML